MSVYAFNISCAYVFEALLTTHGKYKSDEHINTPILRGIDLEIATHFDHLGCNGGICNEEKNSIRKAANQIYLFICIYALYHYKRILSLNVCIESTEGLRISIQNPTACLSVCLSCLLALNLQVAVIKIF